MTTNKPTAKRMITMLICMGILLGALIGFNLYKAHMIRKFMAHNAVPAATVTSAVVSYQTWQPQLAAVGSLRAVRGVDVTTEVAGLVREIAFKSGEEVKAGQVLVRLNDRSDRAQLASLRAAADLSQTVYNRDTAQYDIQAIARAQVDADAADLRSKRAQVEQQAALVEKKRFARLSRDAWASRQSIRASTSIRATPLLRCKLSIPSTSTFTCPSRNSVNYRWDRASP